MKTRCPPGYPGYGFVETHTLALGHMMCTSYAVYHVPQHIMYLSA